MCTAFNSVNWKSVWLLLRMEGVSSTIIELLENLYSNTVSCVGFDSLISDWFNIMAGKMAVKFLNFFPWIK